MLSLCEPVDSQVLRREAAVAVAGASLLRGSPRDRGGCNRPAATLSYAVIKTPRLAALFREGRFRWDGSAVRETLGVLQNLEL